jgi:hypothetical protein
MMKAAILVGTIPTTREISCVLSLFQAYLGHKSIDPAYGSLHRAGANTIQEPIPGLSYLEISRQKGSHFC